jgi:PHD/YefM family antitoxin component YafN of YafNO toxin-antitoxin module
MMNANASDAVTVKNANASDAVTVKNTELATVREAMRELSQLLERLDAGEIEKIVLTQKNQMRAVLLTVERYAELDARPVR